jgi:hypothetical protein
MFCVEIFSKKNRGDPYFFLLSDLIVYCEPKKSGTDDRLFDFKVALPVRDISKVSEIKDMRYKSTNISTIAIQSKQETKTKQHNTNQTAQNKTNIRIKNKNKTKQHFWREKQRSVT